MYNHTMTLYKKVRVGRDYEYVREVVENVHWEDKVGITLGTTNVQTDNKTEVSVPLDTEIKNGDFIVKGNVDIDILTYDNKRTVSLVSELDYDFEPLLRRKLVIAK